MTLPTGAAVTFFFSDVEGSTRRAQELGPDAWETLLGEHDRLVDAAVGQAGGTIVKHEGDGVFAAFGEPAHAVAAAVAFSRALAALRDEADQPRARVRIGIHTGEGRLTAAGADYVGIDVHYAARVSAAANGGQIVVSDTTYVAIDGTAPDGTKLVDVGERRLKDFEVPLVLHKLVVPDAADDGRALRTIDAPTNLPTPPTNFVGREDELETLATALAETRLLTLSGPGGTGKTRLGLRLAAAVADRFPGGTWFVDLAPVRDPALIPATIATAMGIAEEPGTPITRTLHASLKPLVALLVLDSLEQLLPQAATDVAELLLSSPRLRVLVTSRERLRITGEREYAVRPLDADAGSSCSSTAPGSSDPMSRARPRISPPSAGSSRGSRAAARDRARRRPDADVHADGHPRTPHLEPRSPRGRCARPARTPAHVARRHLLEPRAAVR